MTEPYTSYAERILSQARAQQDANRASLLRSQQEVKDLGFVAIQTRLARARQKPKVTPQTATGNNTSRNALTATGDTPRRRPEPPTPTLGEASPHNILWYSLALKTQPSYYDPVYWTSNNTTFTLYSGDLSTNFAVDFIRGYDFPYGQPSNLTNLVCLPVNATTSIAILTYIENVSTSTIFRKAFLVGTSFIKEINIPELIAYFIQLTSPPYLAFSVRGLYDFFCTFFGDTINIDVTNVYNRDIQKEFYQCNNPDASSRYFKPFAVVANFTPWLYATPGAYAIILDHALEFSVGVSRYTPPSGRTALYASVGAANVASKWKNKWLSVLSDNPALAKALYIQGEAPTSYLLPESDWKKYKANPKIAKKPEIPAYTGAYDTFLVPMFYWDWGAPSYCYEQLLALGFTSADLTP